MSNETKTGCLGCVGGEILPFVIGFIISHYRNSYETTSIHPWRVTWNIIMKVWFRSCSVLNGWFVGEPAVNLPGIPWFFFRPSHLPPVGLWPAFPRPWAGADVKKTFTRVFGWKKKVHVFEFKESREFCWVFLNVFNWFSRWWFQIYSYSHFD